MSTGTPSPRPAATGGLFCELYWGTSLADAWSYGPEQTQVHAAPDETAPLPLYGFTLPEEPFLLAERTAKGWRVHIPPSAHVERSLKGDAFHPVPSIDLEPGAGRPSIELREGMTLRIVEGELRLLVQPSVVKERAARFQLKDVIWMMMVVVLFLSAPLAFLFMGPDPAKLTASNERALQQAHDKEAARLKTLGLDKPLRPMSDAEKAARQDAGTHIKVPASFGVH